MSKRTDAAERVADPLADIDGLVDDLCAAVDRLPLSGHDRDRAASLVQTCAAGLRSLESLREGVTA
jgi:hypothetical protein